MRFLAESNARNLPRMASIQNAYNLVITPPAAPIKTVTNPAPITGGAEAEELGAEQVRARAPVRQAEIREATRQSFTVSSTRTVPY